MKAIINGKIVLPDAVVTDRALRFGAGIAALVDPADTAGDEVIDAGGGYVLPGLIDMHIHGYLGEDASDGRVEGVRKMAEGILKNGVTSWLPTTMTVSMEELGAAFRACRTLMNPENNPHGAQVLGVNAEGPFINPAYKGAQRGECVRPLEPDFLLRFRNVVRIATVAPEMPGNLAGIGALTEAGMRVSMGHTGATYDQAEAGIDAGISHATHLFNAMTPLKHRDPGVVGAALTDDRVTVELIADCFHVHPALFEMVARAKGDRLVLITDCTRAGGLGDGTYTLGGQPFTVHGIECRLADGTIAGSVLKLNQALRNFARHTSLPLYQIVRMASLNPARALRVDDRKGALLPGYDADLWIADEDFNARRVYVAGELRYDAEGDGA